MVIPCVDHYNEGEDVDEILGVLLVEMACEVKLLIGIINKIGHSHTIYSSVSLYNIYIPPRNNFSISQKWMKPGKFDFLKVEMMCDPQMFRIDLRIL